MERFRLSLVLGLAALLSAACLKIGPDFSPPSPTVSPAWQDATDRRVSVHREDHRSWWEVFQDPILTNLIQRAYKDNLTLQMAGVRVLAARAQLGIAIGEFFPQTQQAFGQVEKIRLSERDPSAAGRSEFGFYQSQWGVTAAWEIDFWGKFRRAIESADMALMAALADYDDALVSLTADVAAAYIQLRTLEKRLAIARQNVAIQRDSLKIAEARFDGGTTSQRDVEQAKTVLASTQATIPFLEAQLRQTRNALCLLLGLPPRELAELLTGTGEIPAPPPQVAVGIPTDLLRRRPDIRSAEFKAAAQCARIGVAKAELLPAFSLSGSFGFLASDVGSFKLGDMFDWRARTGSWGPSLRWNLFNYGRIINQVRLQDALFQELLLAYEQTVLKAQQEVEDHLTAFLKAQDRAIFLGESAEAALRSLNLAVLQYREGITDFTTVLTAQQALLAQQDALATALGDISRSLVAAYRALGGGWQLREGQELVSPTVREAMARRTWWGRLLIPATHAPPNPVGHNQ